MPYTTRCENTCEIDDGSDIRLGAFCLPRHPKSVGVVRRHVADLARAWGAADEVIEVARLLSSELVTNAVVHPKCGANAVIEVSVFRDGPLLIVECRDPSTELPRVVAVSDPLREHGHGMCLISALAHDHGGHLLDDAGKTVWFELVGWPDADAELNEAGTVA